MPGMNGETRARYGYTITFRCLATGDLVTRRVEGLAPIWTKRRVRPADVSRRRLADSMQTLEDATRDLLRYMRGKQDRVWVIQSFSSPQTIYNDLQRGRDHDPRQFPYSMPETDVVARMGEYNMVAPELLGSVDVREDDQRPKGLEAVAQQAKRLLAFTETKGKAS